MKEIIFQTRNDLRNWLSDNHDLVKEIWIIFYKKHTNKICVSYNEALEEALCFGWIDGIRKKVNVDQYKQKFTPRTNIKNWSKVNFDKILVLIKKGLMTEAGLKKIDKDILSGKHIPKERIKNIQIPIEFQTELEKSNVAYENFLNLAPSYQRRYCGWIGDAKKSETRNKRSIEAIELLEQNKKLEGK